LSYNECYGRIDAHGSSVTDLWCLGAIRKHVTSPAADDFVDSHARSSMLCSLRAMMRSLVSRPYTLPVARLSRCVYDEMTHPSHLMCERMFSSLLCGSDVSEQTWTITINISFSGWLTGRSPECSGHERTEIVRRSQHVRTRSCRNNHGPWSQTFISVP
jgi:hypothetical protein